MDRLFNISALLVFLLASSLCHGQDEDWSVMLNGKVTEDGKPLARVILTLKKEGVQVEKIITAPNGKFALELKGGNDYNLYFQKKGYETKFINYNTKNVPPERVAGLYDEFIFELELFKKMEGLNISILEFPVFKVRYYEGLKNLEYDKKHEAKIRSRLNQLKKDYEAMKKREGDAADSQQQLEAKQEKDKAYNDANEKAADLFKEKRYEEAQDAYRKALEIKPKEPFPKDRIVAIEKLIKERDKTKELSKEMQARYDAVILSADAAFNAGKYTSARSLYRRASLIAPDLAYPKDQIALAEEHLQSVNLQAGITKAADEKYKLLIDRADNEFMGEDYSRARGSYFEASKVKPDNPYPKKRIQMIDKMLAEIRATSQRNVEPERVGKSPKPKKKSPSATTSVKKEEDLQTYLEDLAQKYDEGITEEVDVDGGKRTTRIIVVKNGKANEYTKIVYSWATYYKKNKKDIPKYLFENETKK